LTAQDKANASAQVIAGMNIASSQQIARIQSDTTLTAQDKQDRTQLVINANNNQLQTYLGQLQSSTQLSIQEKAAAASMALANANNLSAQVIAQINSSTQLSITDKQNANSQVIASMNNQNAQIVQKMQNDGNLANIMANGQINKEITELQNNNKVLLQTSTAAASIYNQSLTNLGNIVTNVNMTQEQKATALNDGVVMLNDMLNALGTMSGIPIVQSQLVFDQGGANAANAPTTPPQDQTGAGSTPIQNTGGTFDSSQPIEVPGLGTQTTTTTTPPATTTTPPPTTTTGTQIRGAPGGFP